MGDLCAKAQPTVGRFIPGQGVLSDVRNQTEQVMERKLINSVPPQTLTQILPPDPALSSSLTSPDDELEPVSQQTFSLPPKLFLAMVFVTAIGKEANHGWCLRKVQ